MGHRAARAAVLVLLGCAAAFPGPLCAQDAQAAQAAEEEESLRVRDARRQHAELDRRAQLREAWLSAGPDAREAARERLAALRDPESAPGAMPTLRATSEALRVLRRPSPDETAGSPRSPRSTGSTGSAAFELDPLQRFADALALEPHPGAFEAREEGRGELTTVRVHALWDAHAPPEEFLVNLYWLGPDGEEVRARGEPVLHAALAGQGFVMYVRPPASAPGEWLMVPEVGYEGRTVRGMAVTVECVADLAARTAALADLDPARDPEAALLARDVADVVARGVPLPPGASVAAWLAHVEHGAASERLGDVVPRVVRGLPVAWELVGEVREPRRALVLVDAFSEPPRGWFDGPGKRGWLEAARVLEARVLAVPAPLDDDMIAALRAAFAGGDGAELVLVARGGAVADVLVRRAALAASVDGVALETELGTRAAPPPLEQPALVLDVASRADGEETVERDGRAPLRWVRRRAPAVVADLELPGLVAAWWSEHAADGGGGR